VGAEVWRRIRSLQLSPGEYGRVMAIKYGASLLFVTFLAAVLGLQGLDAFAP
jgi:hypothetical protein